MGHGPCALPTPPHPRPRRPVSTSRLHCLEPSSRGDLDGATGEGELGARLEGGRGARSQVARVFHPLPGWAEGTRCLKRGKVFWGPTGHGGRGLHEDLEAAQSSRPGELRPGSTRGRARSASALCGARGWGGLGGVCGGEALALATWFPSAVAPQQTAPQGNGVYIGAGRPVISF